MYQIKNSKGKEDNKDRDGHNMIMLSIDQEDLALTNICSEWRDSNTYKVTANRGDT